MGNKEVVCQKCSQRKRTCELGRHFKSCTGTKDSSVEPSPINAQTALGFSRDRQALHLTVVHSTLMPRAKLRSIGPTLHRSNVVQVPPWTKKKRTIIEIRGEKNAVPRVISCSIRRDQRRASPIRDCPRLLPCADRA